MSESGETRAADPTQLWAPSQSDEFEVNHGVVSIDRSSRRHPFAPLFALLRGELSRIDARRVVADRKPGFPCRVSLVDADIGEELLLSAVRAPAGRPRPTARRGRFSCARPRSGRLEPGVVPDYVRTRLMSVTGLRRGASDDRCRGVSGNRGRPGHRLPRCSRAREAAYIHLHNANRGCFSCAVRRASTPMRRTA